MTGMTDSPNETRNLSSNIRALSRSLPLSNQKMPPKNGGIGETDRLQEAR